MLRGLNWGHRRAMGPMDSISLHISAEIGTELVWEQQTLGGLSTGLLQVWPTATTWSYSTIPSAEALQAKAY